MQALLKLTGLVDGLSSRIGRLTMWLVLATTLISAGNAIVRKAFGTSSMRCSKSSGTCSPACSCWVLAMACSRTPMSALIFSPPA